MTVPPQAVIDIFTTSEAVSDWQAPGQPPLIRMNGVQWGQLAPPDQPSGFQVVVLGAYGDLTSPTNILLNTYVYLQGDDGQWGSTYQWMYAQVINAVLNAGNYEAQILLLVSFGLDLDMPPSNDALQFLLERGAGPGLQQWETTSEPGSQEGGWIGLPASYILVGNLGYGYAQGTEAFASNGGEPAPADVSVTFTNNIPPT